MIYYYGMSKTECMNCYHTASAFGAECDECHDCYAHYTADQLINESGLSQSEIREIIERSR